MGKRQEEDEATEESSTAANERDMQALREAEKPAAREEQDDDPGPALEFREAAQDDDREEPDDEPQERPQSRRERRGNRYREAIERAERAEQAALRAEQLAQQLQQRVQAPPQQQAPDMASRYEEDYARNQQEQLSLAEFYQLRDRETQGRMPEEERQRFLARSRELQLQASEIAVARAQTLQQSRAQPPVDPYVAMLRAKYSDVNSNPIAHGEARQFYLKQRAAGVPEGPDLLEKALEHGRAYLRGEASPRQSKRPSAQQQSKYTGSAPGSSQARGGGEGKSNGRVTLPEGLSMKEFRRMADKAFPHIKDDQKRYTHYYRSVVAPTNQGD